MLALAGALTLAYAILQPTAASAQQLRDTGGRKLTVVDNADGIVVDASNSIEGDDRKDVHGTVIHRSIFRWGFDTTFKRLRWVPLHITLRSYFGEARAGELLIAYERDDRIDLELRQSITFSPKEADQSPAPKEVMFHLPPMDYAAGEKLHLYVTDQSGNTLLRDYRILLDPKFNEFAVWQPIDRLTFTVPKQPLEGDDTIALAVLGDGAVAPETPKPLRVAPKPTAPDSGERSGDRDRGSRNRGVDGAGESGSSYATPAADVSVTTVEMDMRYLPDHWLGYDAVDIIYLFNPKWDLWFASPGRWDALREWVHTGGRLVVVASMRADELSQSRFPGLTGVTFMGPATVSDLSSLMRGIGERASVHHAWKATGARNETLAPAFRNSPVGVQGTLEAVQLRPSKDVYAVYGLTDDGTYPLVTQCHRGLGTVTTFAFDFTATSLRGWTARPHVLGALLDYDVTNHFRRPPAAGAVGLASVSTDSDGFAYDSNPEYRTFQGKRVVLDQSAMIPVLRRIEQANPVPFPILAVFITLYVLVIGPLDYFLLKKLNLMTWTWFTFIFAAIAFFAFAWYGAEQIRGGEMEVVQVTVLDYANDDTPFYRGNLYAGLFSQKSATYRLYLDEPLPSAGLSRLLTTYVDPMDLRNPNDAETGSSVLGTLEVGQDKQRDIKGILLPQWRIRLVDGTWAGLHNGVRLRAEFSRDGRTLTIINDLPYAIEGVTLWSRQHRGVEVASALGPGGSIKVQLDPESYDGPQQKYQKFINDILSASDPYAGMQSDYNPFGGVSEPDVAPGRSVVTAVGESGDIVRESLAAAGSLHTWQHYMQPPDRVLRNGAGYVFMDSSALDRLDLTTQVMQPQPTQRDPIMVTAMAMRSPDALRSEHPNPVPLRVDGWEPLYTSYVMVRLLAYPPHQNWQAQTQAAGSND